MAGRVPGAPPGDRASYRQAPAITARCSSKGQASREDRIPQGRKEGRRERGVEDGAPGVQHVPLVKGESVGKYMGAPQTGLAQKSFPRVVFASLFVWPSQRFMTSEAISNKMIVHLMIDTSYLRTAGFDHPDFRKLLHLSKGDQLKIHIPHIVWEERR